MYYRKEKEHPTEPRHHQEPIKKVTRDLNKHEFDSEQREYIDRQPYMMYETR